MPYLKLVLPQDCCNGDIYHYSCLNSPSEMNNSIAWCSEHLLGSEYGETPYCGGFPSVSRTV